MCPTLRNGIQTSQVTSRPAASPGAAVGPRKRSRSSISVTPLLERIPLLSKLEHRIDGARSGSGSPALIAGGAGSGKDLPARALYGGGRLAK